ncbi:MAG TPA: histidine phosphatase family protein [Acidimicrobiales bacterium]|nr:histidine phosphatase family protein [Acidimicrobiales bacterium]
MRRKPSPPNVAILVRHGLTPTTGKELPEAGAGPALTEVGRQQVEETARHLAAWRASLPAMVQVYSSPLSRTRETAAIVAKVLDLPLEQDEGLVDCNTGDWAGEQLRLLARKPEWAAVQRYPSGFRFPGGELMSDMSQRAVATVKALVSRHPGQSVVVVSHADPIKAVLADALGLHLDLFQRISVAPASVSAVSYSQGGPAVLVANWTGDASGAPPSRPLPQPRS